MQKIALSAFVDAVHSADKEPTFSGPPVSEYVMQNIYLPMKEGRAVRLSALDFAAFSGDDVNDLAEFLEALSRTESMLYGVQNIFRGAEAQSLDCRSFC